MNLLLLLLLLLLLIINNIDNIHSLFNIMKNINNNMKKYILIKFKIKKKIRG